MCSTKNKSKAENVYMWIHIVLMGISSCLANDSEVVSLDFVDHLMDKVDLDSIAECGVSEMDLRTVAMTMERAVLKLGKTDFTDVPEHWGESCNDIYGFMQAKGDIITSQAFLIRDIRRFFPRAYPEFRARLEKRLVYYNELIGILKHKYSRTDSNLERGLQERLIELHFFTNRFYSEATSPKPPTLNPTESCGVSVGELEQLRVVVQEGAEEFYLHLPQSWDQSCTSILRFLNAVVEQFYYEVRSLRDEKESLEDGPGPAESGEIMNGRYLSTKKIFIDRLFDTLRFRHPEKQIKTMIQSDFQDNLAGILATADMFYYH